MKAPSRMPVYAPQAGISIQTINHHASDCPANQQDRQASQWMKNVK